MESLRVRAANDRPVRPEREFVLYWMIANRRPSWNFALDRAVELARELRKPLVILEALRCDHRWASRRFHAFVLEGMARNRAQFAGSPASYRAYVEPAAGAGRELLVTLAARAAAVVTDEFPCFFLPRMVERAASRVDVRLEAVDANGILPLAAAPRAFDRAVDFRRFLQRELPAHLDEWPAAEPFAGVSLPRFSGFDAAFEVRWPEPSSALVATLPIDASVAKLELEGGFVAARQRLSEFVERGLGPYGEDRNEPSRQGTSRLSAWLHWGHLSAHEVLAAVAAREDWNPSRLGLDRRGSRTGWWGMTPSSEGFLDQLVTWRELGYGFCFHRPDYAEWSSLPAWARGTLEAHASDARPWRYDVEELEGAATHDPIWNAAQTELLRDGRIHNYLRMLWAKKVLEWSATPQEAFATLEHLNNKYSIDGRNPNSYGGIAWCFGRFDRPWGPVRPIFGTIRYMSSENTARKFDLDPYLERYAGA